MRMKLAMWISVLAVGAMSSCAATKSLPRNVDPSSEPRASGPTSHGDLEPVDEITPDPVSVKLRQLLLENTESDCWMVCVPTFQPAYAVALIDPDRSGFSSIAHSRNANWAIDVIAADVAEWKNPSVVRTTKRSLVVDAATGRTLASAWRAVVRRTRYEAPEYVTAEDGQRVETHTVTADGAGYEFRAERFQGQTRSPREGLASKIVRLAVALRDWVEKPAVNQPAALSECVEMAKKLQDEAERAPW